MSTKNELQNGYGHYETVAKMLIYNNNSLKFYIKEGNRKL